MQHDFTATARLLHGDYSLAKWTDQKHPPKLTRLVCRRGRLDLPDIKAYDSTAFVSTGVVGRTGWSWDAQRANKQTHVCSKGWKTV